MTKMVKIEIKDEIYELIKRRAEENKEFGSVEEYVNFVLEEVLKDEEDEIEVYTKEEEEQIKRKIEEFRIFIKNFKSLPAAPNSNFPRTNLWSF